MEGITIGSPPAAKLEKEPMKAPGTKASRRYFPPVHIRKVMTHVEARPIVSSGKYFPRYRQPKAYSIPLATQARSTGRPRRPFFGAAKYAVQPANPPQPSRPV